MKTELEQLRAENERLKEKLKSLKEFYGSTISFNERGLLGMIKASAELILFEQDEHPLSDVEKREWMEKIHSSASRLTFIQQMTRDMAGAGIISEQTKNIQITEFANELLEKPYPRVGGFVEDNQAKLHFNISSGRKNLMLKVDIDGLDIGLGRICQSFAKLNPDIPFEITIQDETDLLRIQLTCDVPQIGMKTSTEWFDRYQNEWVDPVAKAIFKLYGGTLITEKYDSKVVCTLELPLVEMEGADGN